MIEPLPALVETGAGMNVSARQGLLYDATDPEGRARLKARAFKTSENSLVLVPSPLLGHGLEALIARIPPSSLILAVEADERLMALCLPALQRLVLPPGKISLVRSSSIQAIAGKIKEGGLHRFRRVQTLRLNRGHLLHRDFYAELESALLELVQNYWHNRMTSIHLGRLWVRNLIFNLPAYAGAADISALQIDRPVVLAGAGESLEQRLPLLSRQRSRIYLAAVDTALPVLAYAGLQPDLVFATEAQVINLRDFIGSRRIPFDLALDASATPALARPGARRIFFFVSRFTEEPWINEFLPVLPSVIPPLGSVGVTAYAVLSRLTRRPVLLAGLDFFYRPGKTHARGSPFLLAALSTQTRVSGNKSYGASLARPRCLVKTAEGGGLHTDAVLYEYHRQLESLAAEDGATYRLGTSMLPGCIQALADSEAENLLATDWTQLASGRTLFELRRPPGKDRVRGLLKALEERLEQDSRSSMAEEGLHGLEFTCFDFPDYPLLEHATAVPRLTQRRAWYLERVRRASLTLSRGGATGLHP